MVYRLVIIIACSLIFGYAAGALVLPNGRFIGPGQWCGLGAGALLSPMAAICLRRKPQPRALLWWLGPTAACLLVLAPWAPAWATLSIGVLFAFVLCAGILVDMEDRLAPRPNRCEGCGYDLLGNESGVCPECGILWNGAPIDRAAPFTAPPAVPASTQSD